MIWFAAHAVYVFEPVSGRQKSFKVLENVLMVRARSSKSALASALVVARREASDDPSLVIDGKPARQRFLGIRKVVACAADPFDDSSTDGQVRTIRQGTEATYFSYRVASRAALNRLVVGKDAKITLED
jgi:hypothetical protein